MQTHQDLAQSGAPNYYAEHLLQQSSSFKHTRKLQQEEEVSAIEACVQSTPGSIRHADLSALVRAAAASSGSAIHTHALLHGDHVTPLTNGRIKSSITQPDEGQVTEAQA